MTLTAHDLAARFAQHFAGPARFVFRAPGRVNLIGEHTDYNDGFVMPLAIDRAIWLAVRPRDDDRVLVHSLDFQEAAEFQLGHFQNEHAGWVEYLKGVAWSLTEAGYHLTGWEGVLAGDVPRGAGLSSSAALEMVTARAFATVANFPWDPATLAKLGQRA
jgi:galactokinase